MHTKRKRRGRVTVADTFFRRHIMRKKMLCYRWVGIGAPPLADWFSYIRDGIKNVNDAIKEATDGR